MSAFAPKADKRTPSVYVRFVPKADIRTAAGFLIRSPRRRGRAARRSATTQFDASRGARRVPRLLRRDVGDPHDLAPLLGFSGDEGSELLGIERHRHRAEIGEPRLDRRLREHGADLAI